VNSCGASPGTSEIHLQAARSLAKIMAENNIKLVYGGGTVGIMGEIAKTLVSLSGPSSVHGIIPEALIKHEQKWDPEKNAGKAAGVIDEKVFGKTTVVKDMHTRKHLMAKEVIAGGPGSGFVALSGGYGTLEELMEVTTWNQLGIHDRGVIIYNVNGYWDGLISWIKTAVLQGFISTTNSGILVEALDAEEVIRSLREYRNSEGRFNLEWKAEGEV
jgi:uncharacterized protein (TIGR00730 family)